MVDLAAAAMAHLTLGIFFFFFLEKSKKDDGGCWVCTVQSRSLKVLEKEFLVMMKKIDVAEVMSQDGTDSFEF